MSDLHPDHVTPVLALEDQDACSPLVLRSAGLQAAKIIRKLTNDLGYRKQELTRLRADLAAAQEREQRMREALANIMGNMEPDPDDPDRRRMLSNGFARWEALEDDARAALSAMRGEP